MFYPHFIHKANSILRNDVKLKRGFHEYTKRSYFFTVVVNMYNALCRIFRTVCARPYTKNSSFNCARTHALTLMELSPP
jgi:hypothetical protein